MAKRGFVAAQLRGMNKHEAEEYAEVIEAAASMGYTLVRGCGGPRMKLFLDMYRSNQNRDLVEYIDELYYAEYLYNAEIEESL